MCCPSTRSDLPSSVSCLPGSSPNEVRVSSDVLLGTAAVQPHRGSVLLIDDQAMIGEAVRRMLTSESDIDYVYCQDPTTAIQRANEVCPTVVLLDLVMPELD